MTTVEQAGSFLRQYCEFIGTHTNGAWHQLLAERATLRTTIGNCDDYGIERGESGYCFMNAAQAVLNSWTLTDGDIRYVQGVAAAGDIGVPIEHAWLETSDGTVLDNTWEQGHGVAYFGVVIEDDILRAALLRGEVWGHIDTELIAALREGTE